MRGDLTIHVDDAEGVLDLLQHGLLTSIERGRLRLVVASGTPSASEVVDYLLGRLADYKLMEPAGPIFVFGDPASDYWVAAVHRRYDARQS